jgi:uncharacterized protein YqhQ
MGSLVRFLTKEFKLFLSKQYTSIGGQAVIEGVMMRGPNSFVVALRLPDGTIRLRRDQWFGLSKKLSFLKFPFLRGVLVLLETMANGVVSLNYSANIAMEEEEKAKDDSEKKASNKRDKSKEKVSWTTFISIAISFVFGIGLFVFLPHALTALLEKLLGQTWGTDGAMFHAVDGVIKACIFILYIFLIGLLPDIRRVFQYHGAEHKSIATFEHQEELTIENAKKYSTFHPRCGTTFIFFLLFISIVLFSMVFAIVPVGMDQPYLIKHLMVILSKICLTFPIAGISYELIKFAGKYSEGPIGKIISYPGLLLQRLTTREPDDSQLEVALASLRSVLFLEEKYDLKKATEKVVTLSETDIQNIEEMESNSLLLKDFLED